MARINLPKGTLFEPVIRHRLPKTGGFSGHSDAAPFNLWFTREFPEAVTQFGPGFLEGRYEDMEGETHYIPEALNIDAWAAALGGRRDLGLQVIYYPPEAEFYFFDYRACDTGAFCPTSAEKLQVLLSIELMRCAQAMTQLVDIEPLVTNFRAHESLRAVVDRAKTILEADPGFFSGNHGKARMIRGRVVEATAALPHQSFIQELLVEEPDGATTVTECFHTFILFCKARGILPPTRTEFTAVLTDAIRAAFNLGLRHDVPARNGKQSNGWRGISIRPIEEPVAAGRN